VTFHTLPHTPEFDVAAWLRALSRLRLLTAWRLKSGYLRQHRLSAGMIHRLRQAQRQKPVSVIVHNRRDLRQMKYVHKIKLVYDHPLSFLGAAEARAIRDGTSRSRFPLLDSVPAAAKLIGVFGFFGRYKGFDTMLRAMQHLPPDYHLLVFGGVHPREIRRQQPIDPYLASLLDAAYVDTNLFDRLRTGPGESTPGLSLTIDADLQHLLTAHPKDLSGRVHFMGALGDDDFLAGMAICDVVVMPYLEVGQSASGPISQSLELGCRTIASRTQTFLQLSRYHKDRIEFFDIGNHLELAERIVARPQYECRHLAFNTETNKAVYLSANPDRRRPDAD
jgi:glycosyltransferase involved in cell wall biosynthesis